MNCPACLISMNVMDYMGRDEESALVWMKGWRCGGCGYGMDPLDELNRRFVTGTHSSEIPHSAHGTGALQW